MNINTKTDMISEMFSVLMKSFPKNVTFLFIFVVVLMNLLSRITLISLPWVALNAGILISWLSFLILDIIVKHYGALAANILSLIAVLVNLICTFFCVILGRIFDYPILDSVVGGQWSILLASTTAFVLSSLTNNYTNIIIGRKFKENPDSKSAFAARSFISTLLSQIVDNFIFVFLAFVVLPLIPSAFQVRWTILQCFGCSIICAFIEMLSEVIFSPIGYKLLKKWKEQNVGYEYLNKYYPNGTLGV